MGTGRRSDIHHVLSLTACLVSHAAILERFGTIHELLVRLGLFLDELLRPLSGRGYDFPSKILADSIFERNISFGQQGSLKVELSG